MLEHILLQTIIIPVICAPAIILGRRLFGKQAAWIARLGLLYSTMLLIVATLKLTLGGTPIVEQHAFAGPAITMNLLGDGLSLPIALIINMLCTALAFYADHYIDHRIEAIYGDVDEKTAVNHYTRFYALFLLFPTGFMGVCFASNLIGVYFFLEILPLPLFFIMAMFGYIDRVRVAMICLMWAIFARIVIRNMTMTQNAAGVPAIWAMLSMAKLPVW